MCQKICLQACPCIFQPINLTGWGSEGVNKQKNKNKNSSHCILEQNLNF